MVNQWTSPQWCSFEDARKYIRSLKIKSKTEWDIFCKTKDKPNDIPSTPEDVYRNKGWLSWRDWLGGEKSKHDNHSNNYLSFEKARKFVRSIKLRHHEDWVSFCKSGKKPENIPYSAWQVYRNKGWKGIRNWIGIDKPSNWELNKQFLPFEKAREFARSLKLKSGVEWRTFKKSDKRPTNIPTNPYQVYKQEWKGIGDWLGIHQYGEFLSFEQAKDFVHGLHLKKLDDWKNFSKSDKFPLDIPKAPWCVYKNEWKNISDWLGSDSKHIKGKNISFCEAREMVRSLKFQSRKQWYCFAMSDKRIKNIPVNPDSVYKNDGWTNWQDFLGSDFVGTKNRKYLSFEKAREYVHTLNLKGWGDWEDYKKNGDFPYDIPKTPQVVYRKQGWISFGDWVGTGSIAPKNRKYLSFEKARILVQSLNITKNEEWRKYTKSSEFPSSLPANPDQVYKNKGWTNWGDFLGSGFIAHKNRKYMTFHQARSFAQTLKLTSQNGWISFCLQKKLKNIPRCPAQVYKNEWISWPDFLGNDNLTNNGLSFRFSKEKIIKTLISIQDYLPHLPPQTFWIILRQAGGEPTNRDLQRLQKYQDGKLSLENLIKETIGGTADELDDIDRLPKLKKPNSIQILNSLDNPIYIGMDEEAIQAILEETKSQIWERIYSNEKEEIQNLRKGSKSNRTA